MSDVKYYVQGYGRKVAAEKAGIKLSELNKQILKEGVESHRYNKAVSPEVIEEIKLNRMLGKTYRELAEKYGMSRVSMYRYCRGVR